VNTMRTILLLTAAAVLYVSCSGRDGEISPSTREQDYSYREQEIFFHNEKDGITLSGTLTIPDSPRPSAAIILIPNSSTDRDETAGRHRPLRVLAEYIARKGLFVLRADSRGIGRSEGPAWPANTKKDISSDIEAAIAYLRQRPDIAPLPIGLIGHSEGASIATMVAGRSSDVAFVIMLAGPGLPGSRVLCSQIDRVARAFGVQQATIERYVRLIQTAAETLREQPDMSFARASLMGLFTEYLAQTTEAERSELARSGYVMPDNPAGFADGISLPWMKDFLLYDPYEDLRRVRCPVLSVIGEKDMQVNAAANSTAIRKAFEDGGNHDATVMILPGLNHLLQTAPTGSPAEYQEIPETISETALETIGAWISTQVRQPMENKHAKNDNQSR
jgi:pimeloyl-ACP methyl ester carboxylesterase